MVTLTFRGLYSIKVVRSRKKTHSAHEDSKQLQTQALRLAWYDSCRGASAGHARGSREGSILGDDATSWECTEELSIGCRVNAYWC